MFNGGTQQTRGFPMQAHTVNTMRPGDLNYNVATPKYREPLQDLLDDLNF